MCMDTRLHFNSNALASMMDYNAVEHVRQFLYTWNFSHEDAWPARAQSQLRHGYMLLVSCMLVDGLRLSLFNDPPCNR